MPPTDIFDLLLRLTVAASAGFIIGLEREWQEKAAGLRTLALVSLGAAMFVITALKVAPADSVRMTGAIATGVGFLGAGTILHSRGEVLGLTTAAAIWGAAALGVAAALEAYDLVAVGVVLILLVLRVHAVLDIDRFRRDVRIYTIDYDSEDGTHCEPCCLREAGLKVRQSAFAFEGPCATYEWVAVGSKDKHETAMQLLNANPLVRSFSVRT